MERLLNTLSFFQPYLFAIALIVIVLLAAPGCTTANATTAGRTRNLATTAATTAAGGYIGAHRGGDKARNAAIGAAAGYVVGETINHFNNQAQRDAFTSGYEKGQSDAVKQQYWIARDNQRARTADGYEETYYEIPVPATDRDGVHREPTTRVIRVVMPKDHQ